MEVEQIHEFVNSVTKEILGEDAIVNEDLSNIVDIGNSIINNDAIDKYVKSLVNRIGKVIFVNRTYAGTLPSIMMDSWEFGSICEKIQSEMPEAYENESWELEDKASYDPNIFYKPKVSAKFFNNKVTFEIPLSFTEKQVKQSFGSVSELNSFMSMLYNSVEKSLTVKISQLNLRTINNMIGETVIADYGNKQISDNTVNGLKAVNLLSLYNSKFNSNLTPEDAITTPAFIQYATFIMGLYEDRLTNMSTLFNIGGKERFTPKDYLHVILLSEFAKAADAYLMSSVRHNEFTKLPSADIVPYWQGSGKDYGFSSTSKIDIKTASNNSISVSGILGVMFDRDALGVSNLDRRVTTNYNAKAEFFTNFYKFDAGYFNDLDENFIVFFVA